MTRSYNDLESEFKYLIVNEKDRKFGLWVNTVGFQSILPHSPYPIKEHPSGYMFNVQKGRTLHEYQLLYITKGKGTFASDDTPERNIGKGNLIVLFPGQWHTYSACEKSAARPSLSPISRTCSSFERKPFFIS